MWQTFYAVPCPPTGKHGLGHCIKQGPDVEVASPWDAQAYLRAEWPSVELPAEDDTCLIDGISPLGELVYVESVITGQWYVGFRQV